MKKVVRMLGLCALVALAFTSCKKKETTNSTLTFKASITQPKSDDRTYLASDNSMAWYAGDVIKVFDVEGHNFDFMVSTIGSQSDYVDEEGTFEVSGSAKVAFLKDIETPNSYSAFYPQAVVSGTSVTMEIPTTQNRMTGMYVEGSFGTNTYPMFGVNDSVQVNDTTWNKKHFTFRSHAGVLQFAFGAPVNRYVKVERIVITSREGDELYGKMTYPFNYPFTEPYDPNYNGYTTSGTGYQVTLLCGDGVVLPNNGSASEYFHIALLRGALSEGFTVEVFGEKNDPQDPEIILENQLLFTADLTSPLNTIEAEKVTQLPRRLIPVPGQGGEPLN
jgi:hypothetical protein